MHRPTEDAAFARIMADTRLARITTPWRKFCVLTGALGIPAGVVGEMAGTTDKAIYNARKYGLQAMEDEEVK